jgi:hypothetical protein
MARWNKFGCFSFFKIFKCKPAFVSIFVLFQFKEIDELIRLRFLCCFTSSPELKFNESKFENVNFDENVFLLETIEFLFTFGFGILNSYIGRNNKP